MYFVLADLTLDKAMPRSSGWNHQILADQLVISQPGGADYAQTYLQLPLRQWGAGNVYLLVLSS